MFFTGILACLCCCLSCAPEERHILQGGETVKTVEHYQDALRVNPSDVDALFGLGWAYMQQDRTRDAAGVFSQLVAADSLNADSQYLYGVALSKEQRKNEAMAAFQQALLLAPTFVEVHWALALLHNERGDGFADALGMIEEGLRLAEGSSYGHFVLGFVLCSRGENEKAEQALLKSIAIDPSLAHTHYYLALVYLRQRDDVRAIAAMEKTIEADPGYTEAYYSLGTLYARTGRVDEGEQMIELFQQLSRSTMDEDHYRRMLYRREVPFDNVKRAGSHFNLGLVYLRRGELHTAKKQFVEALLLDSTYAEASHNIGVVHSLEARHEEAQLYFEKAIKWKPDYALAHKNLANNHLVQGDYQAAIEVFQLAIGLDPNMAEAYNGLGTALIQQGNISEGKAARARAIELGTED